MSMATKIFSLDRSIKEILEICAQQAESYTSEGEGFAHVAEYLFPDGSKMCYEKGCLVAMTYKVQF